MGGLLRSQRLWPSPKVHNLCGSRYCRRVIFCLETASAGAERPEGQPPRVLLFGQKQFHPHARNLSTAITITVALVQSVSLPQPATLSAWGEQKCAQATPAARQPVSPACMVGASSSPVSCRCGVTTVKTRSGSDRGRGFRTRRLCRQPTYWHRRSVPLSKPARRGPKLTQRVKLVATTT